MMDKTAKPTFHVIKAKQKIILMTWPEIKNNVILIGIKFILLFAILFAVSCDDEKGGDPKPDDSPSGPVWGDPMPLPDIKGESKFQLSGSDSYVNVMQETMPDIPEFPTVRVAEGMLRGFVADLSGRPVEDAFIGVRSSLVGGSYSSASSKTDENGYYEIIVPMGAAEIWAAGYSFNYGTGKASVGLYPADGDLGSFPSTTGLVKNFVLLSYGLADEDVRAEKPWSPGGYFGGSLLISYTLGDPDDIWATPGSLPFDSEIEIELTPVAATFYGENRTFTISKKVENLNFYINNLPIGKYRINARLKDGRELRIRQVGPYVDQYPHHGLQPKDAVGEIEVWFTPMGVASESGTPNYGNWRPVDIRVELPQ